MMSEIESVAEDFLEKLTPFTPLERAHLLSVILNAAISLIPIGEDSYVKALEAAEVGLHFIRELFKQREGKQPEELKSMVDRIMEELEWR